MNAMENHLKQITQPTEQAAGATGALSAAAALLMTEEQEEKSKVIVLVLDEKNKLHRFTANVSYGDAHLMLHQEAARLISEMVRQ